jgi:hypothetical protein
MRKAGRQPAGVRSAATMSPIAVQTPSEALMTTWFRGNVPEAQSRAGG